MAEDVYIYLKSSDTNENKPDIEVNKVDTEKSENSGKSGLVMFALSQFAGTAVNEVTSWVNYEINRDLSLNDDYVGQRNMQVAMTMINKAGNALSSIASGALIGSSFGPVGAAVGAAVGALKAGIGIAREKAQMQDQQNIHIAQMNAALDFTRQRSGWSLTAGSIGEDL